MTFQPGQSGNPAGRPKGSRTRAPLKDALNKYLNEKDKDGQLPLHPAYSRTRTAIYAWTCWLASYTAWPLVATSRP